MIRRAISSAESNSGWVIASRELTIENSTFCGAHCLMCPRDQYRHKWQHMDFHLFKSAVDQGVDLGISSLDFSGFGEFLMDPNAEKKMNYVRTTYPDIKNYIVTTGHMVTEKSLPWICEAFDTIKFSNYGFSKQSYEAVHGGVVKFESVWDNIHKLLERSIDERPYVLISFLIFPENEHELEDWKAHWEPLADEITIWRPHNYGGSVDEIAFRSDALSNHDKQRSCGRPSKGNPLVRWNGEISVCCFDFNHELVVGDITKKTLLEVLQGDKLGNVKNIHKENAFSGCGLLCDGCDQTYDRSDSLVYASNNDRKTNQATSHPSLINDFISQSTDRPSV